MRKKLLLIVLLIFVVGSMTNPLLSEEGYMLRCRGGELSLKFKGDQLQVVINLDKAADHHNVGEGECAWLDRPLNASEPSRLLLYTKKFDVTLYPYNPRGGRAGVVFSDIDIRIKRILNAVVRGQHYSLKVRNIGGYLLVLESQPYG
jgi:hypothetical protein